MRPWPFFNPSILGRAVWIEHSLEKCAKFFQNLNGNFMAPLEFYPTVRESGLLDVVSELLGYRKRQKRIVRSVALENRESLTTGQSRKPFMFGNKRP
jgi:hypothetical protein